MNDAAFRDLVGKALDRHSPTLVRALTEVVRADYPPEVASIEFEVFSDGFSEGFPVRAFLVDADNNDVDPYPSFFKSRLVEAPHVYPREVDDEYFEQNDAYPWSIGTEVCIEWFDRCWEAAGGRGFSRHARIRVHDHVEHLDLVAGKWR